MGRIFSFVVSLVVAVRAFALAVRINDIELEIMDLRMEGKSCIEARARLKSALIEKDKLWQRK